MSRSRLIEMARHNLGHVHAGTIDREPHVLRVPVEHYLDAERWQLEIDRVFKRLPLVLALSAELAEPGAFKTLQVLDVPVLLVRGEDGAARAFVNMCSHRGAQLVLEPSGRALRFVCPYHAWAYDATGALRGVRSAEDFGEVDAAGHGLTSLPVIERAGLVWAGLTPGLPVDADAFLAGYDEVLAQFGFDGWHVVARREVAGPNWKIAYDGYLDLYHLPVLHKDTFGSQLPNRALYYAWGPHQRVTSPDPRLLALEAKPEAEWELGPLVEGVWTIFPHVSIATFDAGGRGALLSQLFPGPTPGESTTVQSYLMAEEPDGEARAAAEKLFELLGYVVREEDYATGLRQQRALATRARSHVLFGRNEGGGQRFHGWLDRLLAVPDDEIDAAFAAEESR